MRQRVPHTFSSSDRLEERREDWLQTARNHQPKHGDDRGERQSSGCHRNVKQQNVHDDRREYSQRQRHVSRYE